MQRPKKTIEYARQLRHADTLTEKLAWKLLRDRQVVRYKFRRQHPIGTTIVDFCCLPLRLVVELDGSIHAQPSNVPRGANRQRYLEGLGYRVARFSNGTVLKAPGEFMSKVKELIAELEDLRISELKKHGQSIKPENSPSPPAPLPVGARGAESLKGRQRERYVKVSQMRDEE
jgi:very-short-patch-repair endonuclease